MSEAYETFCAAFQSIVAAHPDVVALRTPGDTVRITYAEYGRRVRSIAAGLSALGVGHGDPVAMMVRNRPEFNIVDVAALHLGAVPFSIYNTSPAEQIAYLLGNAEARVMITEAAMVDRILAVRDQTALEHIVVVDSEVGGAVSLAAVEASGEPGFDFDAAWQRVAPDDLLTIIYTSGTTGPPKGAEITHRALMVMDSGWNSVAPMGVGDRSMSYLPSAHVVDRCVVHHGAAMHGLTLTTVADMTRLLPALLDTRPTAFIGVPRVYEKLEAALRSAFAAEPDEAGRAGIQRALDTGLAKVRAEQAALAATGPGPDEQLLATYAQFDAAVFSAVRARIGLDAARFCGVGAAPSTPAMLEFFHAIGLPVCEAWGMTELSGIATMNVPGRAKLGTVGRPIPGVEVTLADDGELLCRGALMRGYRKNPEKTAEAVDADGWMHTGDVAQIDADGYVRIVDRKKELIINAAGKNMSPANIEAALKGSSPLIGQAICVGDARPFNVALLVLDPDGAAAYARATGRQDSSTAALAACPEVNGVVAAAVEAANATLSQVEQIKRFTVLPVDWLPDSDELTPTMKLKRKPILAKYAQQIEELYAPADPR